MAFKQRISAIIVIRLIAKILSNLKVIRLILAIKLYILFQISLVASKAHL
jgi:Sec-independent protein secretion pathway component TatC